MRLVAAPGPAGARLQAGRRRRVLAGLTAIAVGLVALAACSSGGPGGPMPTASGTITVAASPGVADAPLFLAVARGMFSQTGLTVKIVNYSSIRAELKDLQTGKVDVAFGDYADMFYAQAQALQPKNPEYQKMTIVADGYDAAANTMEVLTLPHSGITTPKGLIHKTIGTAKPDVITGIASGAPYNLETVATQSVLSNDNVDPGKIRWQKLAPQTLVSALGNHTVNAILATEPTIYQAESQLGAVPVLDSCTGATANLPLDGYFSLRSFAAKHHAALAAFRAGLEQGQAAASQEATIRATLRSSAGMPVQQASLVTLGQYPTSMTAANLQRVVTLMFFFNSLPIGTQVSVQNMIFK